jgi:hypothetical protein
MVRPVSGRGWSSVLLAIRGSSNWTAGPGISGSTSLFQKIDTFDEAGSFFNGVQAGYNYMLPNRILLGAEVDASFPSFQNLSGISIGGTSNFTSPTLGLVSFSETVLSSGTVRGPHRLRARKLAILCDWRIRLDLHQQTLTQISTGNSESPFLWRLGWATVPALRRRSRRTGPPSLLNRGGWMPITPETGSLFHAETQSAAIHPKAAIKIEKSGFVTIASQIAFLAPRCCSQ